MRVAPGDDADFVARMRASAMAKRKAFGKPEAPRSKVRPTLCMDRSGSGCRA